MAVIIIGGGIFFVLSYYCFCYTYSVEIDYASSAMHEVADSVWLHLFAIVIALIMVIDISAGLKKLSEEKQRKWCRIFTCVIAGTAFLLSICWVLTARNIPFSDSETLLNAIKEIENKEYSVFEPGGHLGSVKYQIGIATIFRFFLFLGGGDYLAIQVINALCVPLMIYAGYALMRRLYDNRTMEILYGIFMLCWIPLYLYTSFVYGEILSITAGMYMIWMVVYYLQEGKVWTFLPASLCAALGVLFRGNFWILIIACAIILFLYGISKKQTLCFVLLFCIGISPLLEDKAIIKAYEYQTGIAIDQGRPALGYIAMGTMDGGARPNGWHNGYNHQVYEDAGYNRDIAKEQAMEMLKMRMEAFRSGEEDAIAFYKEKILTQWNEPTYFSFYKTKKTGENAPEWVTDVYYNDLHFKIEGFLNQYQLLVYMGMVLFSIFALKRRENLLGLVFLIIAIGGFFFSILYEANARYLFPYIVCMVPCAAYGWTGLGEYIDEIFGRVRRK